MKKQQLEFFRISPKVGSGYLFEKCKLLLGVVVFLIGWMKIGLCRKYKEQLKIILKFVKEKNYVRSVYR